MVVGETSTNSVLATPAPSWTDAMPTSTSTTGKRLADIGPKPRACASELVGLVDRDLHLLGRGTHAGLRDGGRDRRAVGTRAAEERRLADVTVGPRTVVRQVDEEGLVHPDDVGPSAHRQRHRARAVVDRDRDLLLGDPDEEPGPPRAHAVGQRRPVLRQARVEREPA